MKGMLALFSVAASTSVLCSCHAKEGPPAHFSPLGIRWTKYLNRHSYAMESRRNGLLFNYSRSQQKKRLEHVMDRMLFAVPHGGSTDDDLVGGSKNSTHSDPSKHIETNQNQGKKSPMSSIGVIDLRPDLGSDGLFLIGVETDNVFKRLSATFPTTKKLDTDPASLGSDFNFIGQHAAAARTIGFLCPKIFLIIEYDFKNGKTVLHSNLGGTKLMNFVDGVRERLDEILDIGHKDDACSSEFRKKLVVILVPSDFSSLISLRSYLPTSSSSNREAKIAVDLTKISQWNAGGISFLVDRLNSYFRMGGQEYESFDAFPDVNIFGFNDLLTINEQIDHSQSSKNGFKEIVLDHFHPLVINDGNEKDWIGFEFNTFGDFIQNVFKSRGGVGDVVTQ